MFRVIPLLLSLPTHGEGGVGGYDILTFPVYWVTVIVLVLIPSETVMELPPFNIGSPRELKVNVIVVPIVVPDSWPDGSIPVLVGLNV